MDYRLMMETEEEASVFEEERESQEEDIMESEEEESEEDEEEAEQLEEMRPPVVTSWMGPDGITVHGIICIDDDVDGIIRLKNRCQLDNCSICYNHFTTHGKHQICCLPCGHMYGFSCIKKWLLLSSSAGKCPQCNTVCSFQDAILLYPPPLCVTAHQKASSAKLFPFTVQGFIDVTIYEYSRWCDARLLRAADVTNLNILVTKYNDSACRVKRLARHRVNLLRRAKELEERAESGCLAQADVLRRRARPLGPRAKALRDRAYALKRRVSALRRRIDALEKRCDAFESRMDFYSRMYEEHHKREDEMKKAEHALERKENLAE